MPIYSGKPGQSGIGAPSVGVETDVSDGDALRYKASTNSLEQANASVDTVDGTWTFNKSISVPQGSINIGEIASLSEGAQNLMVHDHLNQVSGFSVNAEIKDTGSELPNFLNFDAEFTSEIQPDFSTQITTNPISYSLPTSVLDPFNRMLVRATNKSTAGMTNYRFRLTDQATGTIIKYVPSKASYDAEAGSQKLLDNPGLTFVAGDNVIDFLSDEPDTAGVFNIGITPLIFTEGQILDIDAKADTMDLLGTAGGLPYTVVIAQDGELTELLASPSLTEGSVPFADSEGALTEDNTNLVWDNTTKRLTVANATITGDALIEGTTTIIDTENLSVTDSFIDMNAGHTTVLAKEGGLVVNYLPTSTNDTTTAGEFIAGIGSTSNPTVDTDTASVFSANDIIQISGTSSGENNGLYEVLTHTASVLTIKGIGTDPTTESFLRNQFIANASDNAVITKVNVSILDSGFDGIWEVAKGSETPLVFSKLEGHTPYTNSIIPFADGDGDLTEDDNFTYDSTLKTVNLQSEAAGSASIEFIDSSDTIKGIIKYSEGADEFSIDVANGLSELHLNEVGIVHRGTNDGRIDVEPASNVGTSLVTLSNHAGGTGLSLEHDDVTDASTIDSEIGNLTIQTTTASTDLILDPTRNVGIHRADPDSVLHIYEDTTETGIQAGLTIEQDGSGDAITQYLLSGGQRWVTGIDNSGSDAFKIASSLDLASNAKLVLETDGRSEFIGQLGVNILPASTMHVYENTATTGIETGLTIEQDGTGDALLHFLLTGDQRWVMGADNSINDDFVIADNTDLGSSRSLTLQTDGKNYFQSTLGVNKIPDSGFILDIGTSSTNHKVGLFSSKAVNLEVGTYGMSNSTNLIFNKDNVGFNQSEFVFYNDNDSAVNERHFHMSFADDIGVDGGITIWKQRNNVAIGPYFQPDSVFTVSENTTETGDQAGLTILQEGTGDAIAQYLLDGGQRWVTGIDNSANDAFKIASSINLGTNDMLVLEPDAGSFLYSHTDDVLTLGNSTGEQSKISVDDGGSPEGVVTGTGGDLHIDVNGELSSASFKKSSGSSTTDWYDIDLVPDNIKVIYNTAEFEAMASGGIITVDTNTTWIFKGHVDSDVRIVFDGATLHISTDQSNQASWTYSGTGTLLSGTGGLRSLEFFDILSSSTGTFADLDMGGRSMNLTLCGLFNWDDLGSLSNGTFISDVSDIFDNDIGFDFYNMKVTISQSNITNTPTGSTPLFTIDNPLDLSFKSISVSQLSGSFNSGASLFRLEPALNDSAKVDIEGCIFGGGELFDTSGSTGTFTSVADAAVPTESITSVTDSSGVARFNFSAPPTLFVNQEVVISGFVTNTSYNGTHFITATGAGYFEVSSIDFGSSETGSFISNSVTITDTGTVLNDGDQITISSDGNIDYDGGAVVYNQLTNSFQVNRTFTTTHTGTWSTEGLDQTDPRVLAFRNPDFIDSKYLASGHIEENPIANTTSIGATDTYQAIDITGTTGFATVFATNGAGGTTCTSTGHGLLENQNVVLQGGEPAYDGEHTIFNVTTNTFDIAVTFVSTVLTSAWTSGFNCNNERFKCTDESIGEITYIGEEPFNGSVKITWAVNKTGAAQDYIFNIGKNGAAPEQGAPYQKRTVTTSTSVHPVTNPIQLVAGDTVQPIVAGVGTTNSILIENLQVEIS